MLADRTGYNIHFWLYQGKKITEKLGLSAKPKDIVMDLINTIPQDREYIVVADSFYGGVDLAELLSNKGWKYILACRGDRPTDLFNKYIGEKLKKKGDVSSVTNPERDIQAIGVYDTKRVSTLLLCRYY